MKRSRFSLVLGLVFCAMVARAADYGFSVKRAEIVPAANSISLNADIDYQFSPRALDALQHGVPLTTVVKVRLNQYRRLIWNRTVFSKNMIYRLSYHALRKRYRVFDENTESSQYFVNLEPALEAMGRIRNLPLPVSTEIPADSRYDVQIKLFLDIEALPLPLRSIAYLMPQWYISSGWYTWSLEELNRR
ncbi:MAG: DUF4390 domain-containing protein [Gammaproteobacteria bacterium]